jgi:hypothetical protein
VDDFGAVAYRFLEMALVAGKSDAVATVLKGILAGFAQFLVFAFMGRFFWG